jgi:hypothetical protein
MNDLKRQKCGAEVPAPDLPGFGEETSIRIAKQKGELCLTKLVQFLCQNALKFSMCCAE